MRIYCITVILCINLLTSYCQVYWLQQTTPVSKQLYKCTFKDSLYGWAVGDSGIIIHTNDGGSQWILQQSGIFSHRIEDIFFLDRNTGWAVSVDSTFKTIVLSTTNSGLNWTKTYFPDSTLIFGTICFVNTSTGFISGYSGRIYKTTSSGANWFESSYDTAGCFYLFPKNDIYFTDAQTGYICGGVIDLQGVILRSTNGGANWNSMCVSPEPMNEIQYRGGNNVYVIGGDYDLGSMFIRTTNTGTNWAYDTTGCFGNATGFSFRTPSEVWAALSFTRKFAVNLDSMRPGSLWQCIPAPDNTEMYDVEFVSPFKGWSVGAFGRVYKYNPNIIGVSPNGTVPYGFELYQNYPNPFNPATVIKYSIGSQSDVKIKIYDILGNEVKIFDEGEKSAGLYSVEFNGVELASGVYFYVLEAGEYKESKKMLIIK